MVIKENNCLNDNNNNDYDDFKGVNSEEQYNVFILSIHIILDINTYILTYIYRERERKRE